jgi:DNA-binding FadR family transcriptional regulator
MIARRSEAASGDGVTVAKTLRDVRHAVLRTLPGDFVGAEEQLAKSYRVSRPTMRQALVLLCQEGLLEARRGPGGGYFAKRPDATAITHNATIYLRSQGTSVVEVIRAIEPIRSDMAVLAAENRDEAQLEAWKEFLEADAAVKRVGAYREFMTSETRFEKLLSASCHNRVLALFMETLHPLGNWENLTERLLQDKPDRVHAYWDHRTRAIQSIIDGDPFLAGVHLRRGLRLLTEWIVADVASRRPGLDEFYAPPAGI